MKTLCTAVLLSCAAIIAPQVVAQMQAPEQTRNQYVTQLQSSPANTALREKIIALVQTMNPPPAIPEEGRRHYVMAKTLFEGAKKPDDFNDSIAEFRKALLIAPWWPEANRDLGLALEAAGQFDEATTYVKLYMATNLGDEQTRAAQDELYKIEAKKQLAAKAAVDQDQQQREEQQRADEASPEGRLKAVLHTIDGRRYVCDETPGTYTSVIDVRGDVFVLGQIWYTENSPGPGHPPGYMEQDGFSRLDIRGFTSAYSASDLPTPKQQAPFPGMAWVVEETIAINADGESITRRYRFNDGDIRLYVYQWQR